MITWRKSSFSGGADENCVEVAQLPGAIAFRDSKNADGPALVIKHVRTSQVMSTETSIAEATLPE